LDLVVPIILLGFSSFAALLSLESKSLVYGAISLAIFFLGLSLFFFYLDLPFLAIFQLAVYVGAIAVLVMFTVMVVGEGPAAEGSRRLLLLGGLGFATIASSFFFAISYFSGVATQSGGAGFVMASLSAAFVTKYGLVILVLAFLLTSAAYGAIALARKEAEDS
jgi:NADH:ubiquinone oxidoreductase subunit 6 (subunit J)